MTNLEVENVDIIEESDYNGYKVTRKNEPSNYVYKRITDKDRARVNSDYMLNKAKYEDDVGVVNFDDVSYAYEVNENGVNIISKFKGKQSFINEIRELIKNEFNNIPQGNSKVNENIRNEQSKDNIINAISRRTSNSRTSDSRNNKIRGRQSNTNTRKNDTNNVQSIQRNLENSEQSSFSLPKNQDDVKDNSQDYEYTNEKEKLHIERAEEIFGYTDDFEKAGYLTWNGKLLDFSDGSDRRIEDHRAINQVFDEI